MPHHPPTLHRVLRITTHQEQPSDYQYWVTRPVAERLDALEWLRQSYLNGPLGLNVRNDVTPRLQRVYRITQPARG